jgi:outer membrane protein assembly factor BamB
MAAGCKVESVDSQTAVAPPSEKPPAEKPPAEKPPAEKPPETKPAGGEWPAWRGPDGTAFSPDVPREMPAKKLLWSQEMLGEAHAPLSCAEGVLVAVDYGAGMDHWRGFDAEKGTPLWDYSYPNDREMDYGPAPRCAPLIHQGKVYGLDAFGTLHVLDLKKGALLWKKDFLEEFKAFDPPTWGYCSSPLIAGGKLIVNPGGRAGSVAALNPDSGAVLWTAKQGWPNYGGFIAAKFGGVEQVAGYEDAALAGFELATGKRLFSLPVDPGDGYIVPTPVNVGGKLLVSTEQENTHLHAFEEGGKVVQEAEAENQDVYPEMATPAVWNDTLLCASEGIVLLDPNDGLKALWRYDEDPSAGGLVFFFVSKDRALAFCDDGNMILLAFDRTEPKPLGKLKLCRGTYVCPAVAYGKIYVRDTKTLACYDLKAKAAD